jgi:hypothetical protein
LGALKFNPLPRVDLRSHSCNSPRRFQGGPSFCLLGALFPFGAKLFRSLAACLLGSVARQLDGSLCRGRRDNH